MSNEIDKKFFEQIFGHTLIKLAGKLIKTTSKEENQIIVNNIELGNKIPDISNLATKTALTAIENKIPSVSSLVKKTDYNTKITDIENKLNNHNHDKYIDTSEFNKLAADVFNARLAQAGLITKTEIFRKITQNKSKHLLVEN